MNICILIGTFRPDIAFRVMTESTTLIIKAKIDLQFILGKLLEEKLKEEELEVTGDEDLDDEVSDKLLQTIIAKVNESGKVFGTFINILKEENTIRAEQIANKLMKAYNKYINVY